MLSSILLFLLPVMGLAAPASLQARKALPYCKDNAYPTEETYQTATSEACDRIWSKYNGTSTLTLDQSTYSANLPVDLYQATDVTSASYYWDIIVLNGYYAGQVITKQQCNDYFLGQGSIQEQYSHLCIARDVKGSNVTLVKGWDYSIKKSNLATARFKVMSSSYSHKVPQ